MKIWVVYIKEECNSNCCQEFYTNEKTANDRADYINENFFMVANVNEVEVLENPIEGYPEI